VPVGGCDVFARGDEGAAQATGIHTPENIAGIEVALLAHNDNAHLSARLGLTPQARGPAGQGHSFGDVEKRDASKGL
jgi:hypothetical protein